MRFTVQWNREIAPLVWHMRLLGDTRAIRRPGQFVQIAVPGFYLRRPISVCDWNASGEGTLDLLFKAVGHGTEALSGFGPGESLDALTGLGNGYAIDAPEDGIGETPLLVGGGLGAPPLYGLCKRLLAAGKRPSAALGFQTAREVFFEAEWKALGIPYTIYTQDGSLGERGFVTEGLKEYAPSYVFVCGPEPMLKAAHALCESMGAGGQFCFEERMACGFGVCMGCSCRTLYGSKRICTEGPVLLKEEIAWP